MADRFCECGHAEDEHTFGLMVGDPVPVAVTRCLGVVEYDSGECPCTKFVEEVEAISEALGWNLTGERTYHDVSNCARCGRDHLKLQFRKLKNPPAWFDWWAWCPVIGEPVFMRLNSTEPT